METENAELKPTTNVESSTSAQAAMQAMLVQITTDGIPKLHCPVCDKALVSLNGYVKHVKKHEPPGGFLCRYCEARFCSDDELKKHRDAVHTTIACRICKEVTFTNEDDYREHIRVVHNGIDREMFRCEKCNAEYKTIEPFRRHMETQCGTIKPHKCDQCDMTFVTKYNLKQHKESHTGERKYCCSYCGKNFLQKGRLVEHERSHTGEKPYKCDVCGKCFAHRESIVTHSSIHTGIRLVECKCCLSRFSCYSNLIKHRRTRPDTCGQPEYDPPKNRVRTHRSRIPPTLNPTSEIKISSVNKIIKPLDKEQYRKPVKKETNTEKPPAVKRPRKGKKPGPKPRAKRKKKQSSSDSDTEEELPTEEEKPNVPLLPFSSLSHSQLPDAFLKQSWSDSNSDEDRTCNDPIESDSEEESKALEMVAVKTELVESIESNELKEEAEGLHSQFEYSDAGQCMSPAFNVKTEDEVNIFSEKDKLLDCLLNDEEHTAFTQAQQLAPLDGNAKLAGVDSLEEPEVVLIKNENDDAMDTEMNMEEDIFKQTNDALEELVAANRTKKTRRKRAAKTTATSETTGEAPKENAPRKKRAQGDAASRAPKRMAKISQKELRERLKIAAKETKSWPCPHCVKIYHMRKPYEKHLREDHKRPEEEIRSHMKTDDIGVVNDEIFKCHICDKIYLVEKRLLAHIQLHGPEGNLTFKCPCYCSIYFASKEDAQAHAQKEHRDLIYCEICDKFMMGHDSLKTHMKNSHSIRPPRPQTRNLVCDKCGKKFYGRTSLTDHVRSDCGRVPLYECNVCGKHLTTAGILKTHMLLHKDDTPFQCHECGKTFKVKAQYKTHLRTRHTEYKPFKCHLCPKEYPYRESLLTHMTVHTGIKRFLCNGCGKRFTCISNLQAHRKVQADTCGVLPLNAKATQYMGVQKGNLLLGAKPEAGLDYIETNTMVAKDILYRDLPMAPQELNFPSEPSAPLATVPLNCSLPPLSPPPARPSAAHLLQIPQMMISHFMESSHAANFN